MIWGDDIGTWNVSHNSRGMMGYQTPNIEMQDYPPSQTPGSFNLSAVEEKLHQNLGSN